MSESKIREREARENPPEVVPDRSEETATAVKRFAELEAYLPGASPTLCLLARYISRRMNARLLPQGLAVALELSVRELEKGEGYVKDEDLSEFRSIIGLPHFAYVTLLRMNGTELAKVGFSEAFAEQAMRFYRG